MPLSDTEREARRARIAHACRHFAADVDRDEHIDAIVDAATQPPFGAHTGYWMSHKHPLDLAAELEERWRFPA